ncbi:Glutaredoxin-3 Grx3 [Proteiniborus sp. DW1]|uniref:glutaredoxin 3 n=1 Tax=Proteiniborus sp. DW1 TaxID=1889883 RepID=UPI00092DF9DA|nr:glutaredoxin 3 [Proteiniborus sp. DW1]SCG81675.1 Glutaredoxin-3 Grx3 [Proteiniborus sp. DW1]
MSKNVLIYTFETCPYCIRAKRLLSRNNIEFQEVDITNDEDKLNDLEKKTGVGTVPQIFVDGNFIGGCDDLYELYRNKEFPKVFGE